MVLSSGRNEDSAVWTAVEAERRRQESQLELIASENHASREVMAAMGTVRKPSAARAAASSRALATTRRW